MFLSRGLEFVVWRVIVWWACARIPFEGAQGRFWFYGEAVQQALVLEGYTCLGMVFGKKTSAIFGTGQPLLNMTHPNPLSAPAPPPPPNLTSPPPRHANETMQTKRDPPPLFPNKW